MAKIVVCGYMIRHPLAGNLLAYFHYVLGLARLGHEVVYLEESGWPRACFDPQTGRHGDDPAAGLRAVQGLLDRYNLRIPVYYVTRESGTVAGGSREAVARAVTEADLLLNIGGVCRLPVFQECRRRALIDMDPVFTQLGQFGGAFLDEYQVHFSYGANIGGPGCSVPTAGVRWYPLPPPVAPEVWAGAPPPGGRAFTTVANWSAYGAIRRQGIRYAQKSKEFLRLGDLPRRVPQRLELALAGAGPATLARLGAAGWAIRDGLAVSADLATYRAYIGESRGELSVAKHAYVITRSGWFSDRSVCYLAAGRPAVLQDTGFSDWLPTGRGVLAFSSAEEAAAGLAAVDAAYPGHCRAAREIAEQVFSYRVVLPRLLAIALGPLPAGAAAFTPGRMA